MAARQDDRRETGLSGVGDAVVFLLFVAVGAAFIVWSKLTGLPPLIVTSVPVQIMLIYAAAVIFIRSLRLTDDLSGDNLYYMGFLFTLTSLAVSLWQFDADGSADDIVRNFGIAIASTIAGIALRIFLNQMRRDPGRVERATRVQLADSARRIRRELDDAVLEFSQFRRATRQAADEHWAAVRADVATSGRGLIDELRTNADASVQPIEAASRRSGEAVDGLAQSLAAATDSIDAQARRLAAGVDGLTVALEAFTARMAALGEPDRIVSMRVEPLISPLSAMVESFSHSLTMHAESLRGLTDRLDMAAGQQDDDRAAIAALKADLEAITGHLRALGPDGSDRQASEPEPPVAQTEPAPQPDIKTAPVVPASGARPEPVQ